MLQDEQSDTGQEQLVRTFRLKERRASEVIVLLRSLLGLENEGGGSGSGGGSSGSSSQLTSMMRQMQQQMQKISSSSAAKGGGSGSKEPTKTRLVLNQRENMILVQAAPDQMAIIDKAIE
ncbi:MAG TPA: hypothetical protein EYG03_25015 [Planctomycetes bacterium]|nr:hypothetical protein [Planctomycetota bacterium]